MSTLIKAWILLTSCGVNFSHAPGAFCFSTQLPPSAQSHHYPMSTHNGLLLHYTNQQQGRNKQANLSSPGLRFSSWSGENLNHVIYTYVCLLQHKKSSFLLFLFANLAATSLTLVTVIANANFKFLFFNCQLLFYKPTCLFLKTNSSFYIQNCRPLKII